jgi:hypothetical protein
MSQAAQCVQCGGIIAMIGALAGQCPRCLMQAGLEATYFVPAAIGRYRVIRLIGQGGMGSVYEAEQDQPRRTVALKIIRPGMTTPELLRRFEQETEALGRLHHPGIAQIYEASTADAGFGTQPYFAMEYVRGCTLSSFVKERELTPRDRLDLMARICDAVQHAHQRGLIHRDLKPGNILVDDTGQPKILDFGVARLTDQDTQTTSPTNMGQLVGTVAYMSPEQVLADPLEIDTRTDVYSLGVILYELLSGQLPYCVDKNLHEALSSIRNQDPVRLSSVNRAFRGDVETIVAKALEKDRGRRYASVAELGADLRRYLANEPITAHPPDLKYQMKKFVLRRKRWIQTFAAALVLLLAGGAIAAYQVSKYNSAAQQALKDRDKARRAQREREFAREAVIADVSAVSSEQLRAAMALYIASFANTFAGQPKSEARVRDSFADTYLLINLPQEARAQRELAERLRQPNEAAPVSAPFVQPLQRPGWNATGSPTASRGAGHRVVLLPSGKVLAVGGQDATAELYDPAMGRWSVTGSLGRSRERPIALLLKNGEVLVAGGTGDTSAELYDPGTGTWRATGSLAVPRRTASGVLLKDGRVLITGGSPSPVAELYDPVTAAWSSGGTMTAIRSGAASRPDAKYHTSTLLADGRVLVVGGGENGLTSAELYDPASGNWTATGSLATPRFNHSAILLPNGKVLVAGGAHIFGKACPALDDADRAELYDPVTGQWSAAGRMTSPRAGHASTLLPNGNVLVAGVANGDSCFGLGSSEIYDPSTDRWSDLGNLKTAAIPLQIVLLENRKVLAAGGNGSGADLLDIGPR